MSWRKFRAFYGKKKDKLLYRSRSGACLLSHPQSCFREKISSHRFRQLFCIEWEAGTFLFLWLSLPGGPLLPTTRMCSSWEMGLEGWSGFDRQCLTGVLPLPRSLWGFFPMGGKVARHPSPTFQLQDTRKWGTDGFSSDLEPSLSPPSNGIQWLGS